MAKDEISVYERIEKQLYKSDDDAELQLLTETEKEIRKRVFHCVNKKMDNPLMLDADLVRFLMNGGSVIDADGVISNILFKPVSRAQAYRDVAGIIKIAGNVSLHAKSWYRYMIIEGCKKGYEIAVTKEDAAGVAANMDKIGKYTRADKEDDDFDWTQMIPPNMEVTDDVTVLEGIEPIEDLETVRNEFRNLFKKDLLKRSTIAEIDKP
jgi:hypothetical protein